MFLKKHTQTALKKYGKRILYSLWLPLFWCLILVIEILFLADQKREQLSFLARLFEDLVIVMSFLFYNSQGIMPYLEKPFLKLLSAFFIQFFFWWFMSFLALASKNHFSKKVPKKD